MTITTQTKKLTQLFPLDRTVGIELTFSPKFHFGETSSKETLYDDIVDLYRPIVAKVFAARRIGGHVSMDPGCIEIQSPVFHDWRPLLTYYARVAKSCEEAGLFREHPYHSGGGGHIHVGVDDWALIVAVTRDMANRPYLNWIFNDPLDDENASGMDRHLDQISFRDIERALRMRRAPQSWIRGARGWDGDERRRAVTYVAKMPIAKYGATPKSKSHAVRHCTSLKTLEFRFFDAAESINEQVEHVAFVIAYLKWIKVRLEAGDDFTVDKDLAPTLRLTQDKAFIAAKFNELLTAVGLPLEPYQKYLGNVDQRIGLRTLD